MYADRHNDVIRRIFRIAATGFSFVLFGLGGIVYALIVWPLLTLVIAPARKAAAFRRIISALFRSFVGVMRALGLISYEISGLDDIRNGSIIVANHPSLIDVVFLLGWLGDTGCIVKGALFKNLFTFGPVTSAGYLNSDTPDLSQQAAQALQSGLSLLIFPEGTRSRPGESLKLHRGAAHLALSTGADLRPVTIAMAPLTLAKGQRWWHVPKTSPHFSIAAHSPWPMDRYPDTAKRGKQARRMTDDLSEFLSQKSGWRTAHPQSPTPE